MKSQRYLSFRALGAGGRPKRGQRVSNGTASIQIGCKTPNLARNLQDGICLSPLPSPPWLSRLAKMNKSGNSEGWGV